MVPNAGLTELLNRMFGVSANATPYVAVGTGTTAPAEGDTTLETEVSRKLAGSVAVADNVATIKGFFNTAEGNGTISETGLLTAAAAGVLLAHDLETPAPTKLSTQEMIVEYTVTLERG